MQSFWEDGPGDPKILIDFRRARYLRLDPDVHGPSVWHAATHDVHRCEGADVTEVLAWAGSWRGSIRSMIDWRTVLDVDGYKSRPGVDVQTVHRTESMLGRRLPSDLVALYRESDGVLDVGGEWFVIWPIDELVSENLARWDASDLPRRLLAFGDDGAGYPFCLQDHQPPVVCWYPIDQEGVVLAPDIESFWRGWTAGSITT